MLHVARVGLDIKLKLFMLHVASVGLDIKLWHYSCCILQIGFNSPVRKWPQSYICNMQQEPY